MVVLLYGLLYKIYDFTVTINDSRIPDPSASDSWLVLNVQQYGYYRVNYDDSNWNALMDQLKADPSVSLSFLLRWCESQKQSVP